MKEHLTLRKSAFAPVVLLVLGYAGLAFFSNSLAYAVLACTALLLLVLTMRRHDVSDLLYVLLGVTLLAITPITTEIDVVKDVMAIAGIMSAYLVPYFLMAYFNPKTRVHINVNFRHTWTRQELGYMVFAAAASLACMAPYFMTTNAHTGWHLETTHAIVATFGVILIVGIWEEFFFTAFFMSIFRRYFPFWLANVLQAVLFSGFLYQIGFKGLIVPFTFIYALYRGHVYKKTKSLFVTITIHIVVDVIVFALLLASARPDIVAALLGR